MVLADIKCVSQRSFIMMTQILQLITADCRLILINFSYPFKFDMIWQNVELVSFIVNGGVVQVVIDARAVC